MNLTEACLALEVSRSGYHDHRRKPRGKRRQQDRLLACALGEEFTLSRQTYGSPRLVAALRQRGLRHGKNRVRRLMREQHLQVRQKRRFVPRTTQADKNSHPRPTCSAHNPRPRGPTRPGSLTFASLRSPFGQHSVLAVSLRSAPTCPLAKAGCMSPPRWTSTAAASSVGMQAQPRH